MSIDWYQDVLDFHKKFGCEIGAEPSLPASSTVELRKALVQEEIDELFHAMQQPEEAEALVGIADALADSIYVLIGFAITYGIDLRPIWDLVHASNMAKEGGATRADGKIMKPEGWKSPEADICKALAYQCL